MPKVLPRNCAGLEISFEVTRNARLEIFLRLPINTRSLPAKLLASAAAPPMTAAGTSPDTMAAASIGEL